MIIIACIALFFLVPLFILGAHYAGHSFSDGAPFRYRVSPLNIASALAFLGIIMLYAGAPDAPDGNNWMRFLTPFLLAGVVVMMLLDMLLQWLLRKPKTLYITEALLFGVPLLAFGAKWFLGASY